MGACAPCPLLPIFGELPWATGISQQPRISALLHTDRAFLLVRSAVDQVVRVLLVASQGVDSRSCARGGAAGLPHRGYRPTNPTLGV
jgi:hypothetical protein